MAGVQNNTARQYNLRHCSSEGLRATVRLKPGFNVVDDKAWAIVSQCDYVTNLKNAGRIDFGKVTLDDDADLAGKHEGAQSKVEKPVQKAKSKK